MKLLFNTLKLVNSTRWTPELVAQVKQRVQQQDPQYQNFEVKDNNLYWKGKKLITKEEIVPFLTKFYTDPKTGFRGRDILYHKLSQEYAGISKNRVMEFLNSTAEHQRCRRPAKPQQVVPLLVAAPYKRWQMDLVDFQKLATRQTGSGRQYNWLLVVVDVFSKYVYLEPLPKKDGESVTEALHRIFKRSKILPVTIQSDNGNEFRDKNVKELLSNLKIKQVFSGSYKPTSQGAVERTNMSVKGIIRRMFEVYQNKNWSALLPEIEWNINHSIHSSTGKTPAELHQPPSVYRVYENGVVKDMQRDLPTDYKQERHKVYEKLKAQAAERIMKRNRWMEYNAKLLQPGARVRVRVFSLKQKSLIKEEMKDIHKKYKAEMQPFWSEKIYTIKKVFKSKLKVGSDKELTDTKPLFIYTYQLEELPDKRFTINELLYVPPDTKSVQTKFPIQPVCKPKPQRNWNYTQIQEARKLQTWMNRHVTEDEFENRGKGKRIIKHHEFADFVLQ